MSGATGGSRNPRRAGVLAVVAAVAVLATGCGFVHVHIGSAGSSASTGPVTYRAGLAYAQCMRAHGLSRFPDPSPGGASFSWHLTGNPNSPAARANHACQHLLHGSTGTGGAAAPATPSSPGAVAADLPAHST